MIQWQLDIHIGKKKRIKQALPTTCKNKHKIPVGLEISCICSVSVIQDKVTKYPNKQENSSFNHEKNQSIETEKNVLKVMGFLDKYGYYKYVVYVQEGRTNY